MRLTLFTTGREVEWNPPLTAPVTLLSSDEAAKRLGSKLKGRARMEAAWNQSKAPTTLAASEKPESDEAAKRLGSKLKGRARMEAALSAEWEQSKAPTTLAASAKPESAYAAIDGEPETAKLRLSARDRLVAALDAQNIKLKDKSRKWAGLTMAEMVEFTQRVGNIPGAGAA